MSECEICEGRGVVYSYQANGKVPCACVANGSTPSACSLNPHSVFALWSEDGTECELFLYRGELEGEIDPEKNYHLAEYVLKTSEIIGENKKLNG